MEFDKSFFKEEMRSGFLVTEKRKKIWYTELQILEKFDEICTKHNLTYFVYYGTLLGAVRHQGFIPWDDDIDVAMFRDEYTKFQAIVSQEISEPYFYQDSYNDQMLMILSKIRDSRTTAIEFPNMGPDFNQGIFIDIFPLDDVPDNKNFSLSTLKIQYEFFLTLYCPDVMRQHLKENRKFAISPELMTELLNLPDRERFRQFEAFNLEQFGRSENVNYITSEMLAHSKGRKKEWHSDIVYLPFEHLTVPAPAGYDQILKSLYGDYNTFIKNGSAHEGIFFDPDIPYRYYINYLKKLH